MVPGLVSCEPSVLDIPNSQAANTGNQVKCSFFALISAAVFVTLFGWSNPEAFIVETNITAATELDAESSENGFDEFYLLELSEDATPALADNFDSLSVDSQDVFCSRGTEETYGILGYNRAVRSSNDQIDATC